MTDLPDPLDQPATPPQSSPDDLLSRLADEAIDKLMADAEKGTPPPRAATPEGDPRSAGMQSELDALFDQMASAETPAPAGTAAIAPVEASEPKPIPSPPANASSAGEVARAVDARESASAIPSEPPHPASAESSGGRGADVKALLDEAVATAPPAAGGIGSVLLLPLRLLNAPFQGLSDRTRDALGQIGIVTLLNAVAVLVYVLWFRRG